PQCPHRHREQQRDRSHDVEHAMLHRAIRPPNNSLGTATRPMLPFPRLPMHLYETHLPVADTELSQQFYIDVVGLHFAYRDPTRDIVFLFIGPDRRSMLGLWGPTTTLGRDPRPCHFAIAIELPELLVVGQRLNARGIA